MIKFFKSGLGNTLKPLYTKEKLPLSLTATLNKHEDIKRESIKNLFYLNPVHKLEFNII